MHVQRQFATHPPIQSANSRPFENHVKNEPVDSYPPPAAPIRHVQNQTNPVFNNQSIFTPFQEASIREVNEEDVDIDADEEIVVE